MADLEKNILVVIPVNEDHKKFLEEKAASGNKNCCVRYVNGSDVTAEDVKEANVIIGNVDPALVKEAKNLELFQLNSAVQTSTSNRGSFRNRRCSQMRRVLTGLPYRNICWR